MIIDTEILEKYYMDQLSSESHWVYGAILSSERLFEQPKQNKDQIRSMAELIHQIAADFEPYNQAMVYRLFPDFQSQLDEVCLVLAVGLPAPYDALVRSYHDKEYIIFDLAQFLNYGMTTGQVHEFTKSMLTHEGIHLALHHQYPVPEINMAFKQRMDYLCFDEGFAHLLSTWKKIECLDFADFNSQYLKAKKRYQEVVTNPCLDPQLEEANSGPFWEKFGAIYGCLTLLKNRDQLERLYQSGPDVFAKLL